MSEKKQKNFRLSPAVIKRLQRIGKAKGWSATKTIEYLIRSFPL